MHGVPEASLTLEPPQVEALVAEAVQKTLHPIDSEVALLHQYAWSPGRVMHADWWDALGIAGFAARYAALDGRALRSFNHWLCAARPGPSSALPAQLTRLQKRLLRMVGRLPKLLTALGLQRLETPDYLLMKPYRQALLPRLEARDLRQIWGLWRGGDERATLSPELLLETAFQTGFAAASAALDKDPVWSTIMISLPPPSGPPAPPASTRGVVEGLLRLERFL